MASVAVAVLLFSSGTLAQAQTFPQPLGRVSDFAEVIDASVEADLDRRLDDIEQKTSSEIAVATVRSLEGTTVDDYANRLFKAWAVGQRGTDNGVLVLVAPNEREIRIEVGYGLEGVLPDGLAGEIIRDAFIPRFRDNDYSGGIRDGVARIADIVEKHEVLTPEQLARFNGESSAPPTVFIIAFLALFVAIGAFMFGLGIGSKTVFPMMFGSLFGGIPLAIGFIFTLIVTAATLLPLALAMFLLGRRFGRRPSWQASMRRDSSGKPGKSSSSGWTFGGGGSSSGSGGSSSRSGSSSSFGGGRSGGGGASGKW